MREKLFKVLGLFVIAASFGVGWFLMDVDSFANRPMEVLWEGQRVEIPPGSTLSSVADRLYAYGLIEKPRYFALYGRWMGKARKVQAGEYAIEEGMTPRTFLDRIVSGAVVEYSLTLVEGWTFRQMMDAVRANDRLQQTLGDASDAQIMERIGVAGVHPEGQFYPDTYRFPTAMTDVEFLKRAYAAMQEQLQQAWAQRAPDLPLGSPYEALILASIVERETGKAEERPEIAGVFVRRLQKGMRLQTDPTVIYGMGEKFDGNIRRDDLLQDTPYNTYTRKGLPPTPIAMPGKASLLAAVNPAGGEAIYFVARGDGSHQFSATLDEHNQAVRDYQLKAQP